MFAFLSLSSILSILANASCAGPRIIADDATRVSELQHCVLENGKLHRTDPAALTPQPVPLSAGNS